MLVSEGEISVKRACKLVNMSRAAYYRQADDQSDRDPPVIEAFNAIVAKHGRLGFWKCHRRLRLDGRSSLNGADADSTGTDGCLVRYLIA